MIELWAGGPPFKENAVAQTSPFEIQNVAMNGSDKNIIIPENWKTVIFKMRETDVAFTYESVNPSYAGAYGTIAAGGQLVIESDNFEEAEVVVVNAASGTMEVTGSIRHHED